MLEVVVAPLASRDLNDIYSYIEADKPAAAREVLARFERLIALLSARPYVGSPVVLPKRPGLRKISLPPYIVFYRLAADRLEIVRLLHSARDLDAALSPGVQRK